MRGPVLARWTGRSALTAGCLLTILALGGVASAATIKVTTTGDENDLDFPGGAFDGSDDGKCDVDVATGRQCTLRAAIQRANRIAGADTIAFNVPGAGLHTIAISSELPRIRHTATIDGYTQPGSSRNTVPLAVDGTNAVLTIALQGGGVFSYPGLAFEHKASNSVVRGLALAQFDSAIALYKGTGYRVTGNFMGTTADGTGPLGNSVGLSVYSSDSVVGGATPAARNLVSDNGALGMQMYAGTGNRIQGNIFGAEADGVSALPNGTGMIIGTSSTTIGDPNPADGLGAANLIAFNANHGVQITTGATSFHGDRILSNSVHSNDRLGIDLFGGGLDGVTPNDGDNPATGAIDPDTDDGANRLQNYPLIGSAQIFHDPITGDVTLIGGTLDSLRSTPRKKQKFTIQFFNSSTKDPSGYGEAETFLGQTKVTTDEQGHASFQFSSSEPDVGDFVTATATRKATRDTSELSAAKAVTELEPGR